MGIYCILYGIISRFSEEFRPVGPHLLGGSDDGRALQVLLQIVTPGLPGVGRDGAENTSNIHMIYNQSEFYEWY